MENKYYTPSIEEFYVGFEIEKLDDGWKPLIVTIKSLRELWGEYTHNPYKYISGYRVKALDRQDIEGVGFRYIHSGKKVLSNTFYNDEEDIELYHNIEESKIVIEHINNGILFWGKIKNKSELKRILTMIGI